MDANLSEKHRLILKDAYLHPYEKYVKSEKAKLSIQALINQNA